MEESYYLIRTNQIKKIYGLYSLQKINKTLAEMRSYFTSKSALNIFEYFFMNLHHLSRATSGRKLTKSIF